jgi:hypothetical protein
MALAKSVEAIKALVASGSPAAAVDVTDALADLLAAARASDDGRPDQAGG